MIYEDDEDVNDHVDDDNANYDNSEGRDYQVKQIFLVQTMT